MADKGSKKLRRGNNEGSIRFRDDRGNWEAQVTVKGKRITKIFKLAFPTYREGLAAIAANPF